MQDVYQSLVEVLRKPQDWISTLIKNQQQFNNTLREPLASHHANSNTYGNHDYLCVPANELAKKVPCESYIFPVLRSCMLRIQFSGGTSREGAGMREAAFPLAQKSKA